MRVDLRSVLFIELIRLNFKVFLRFITVKVLTSLSILVINRLVGFDKKFKLTINKIKHKIRLKIYQYQQKKVTSLLNLFKFYLAIITLIKATVAPKIQLKSLKLAR